MMQQIRLAIKELECSLALFSEAAWHHNVSVRSAESGMVFECLLERAELMPSTHRHRGSGGMD